MIETNFDFEREFWNRNLLNIAGVDEVGRGAWAGPVVTAAVILPHNFKNNKVTDSKKLSINSRKELAELIKKQAICYSIAEGDNLLIDQINILNATKETMSKSISDLSIKPDGLLIDAVELNLEIPTESIIKGDQKSLSIAAASIIAKVYRDELMIKFAETYPEYNFQKNKGYGTKEHRVALNKYGPVRIHRNSFAPVKIATL